MNRAVLQTMKGDTSKPEFSVSLNFEDQMLSMIREATSIDLELITADKKFYYDDQHGDRMVQYTLELSEEKQEELLVFGRRFAEAVINLTTNFN